MSGPDSPDGPGAPHGDDRPDDRGTDDCDLLANDRALGDHDLVEELRRTGCRGLLWELTENRLVAYGVAVLHDMILTGSIAPKSAGLGRPVRLQEDEKRALTGEDDDRESLVGEAVALGLKLFRTRAILGGEWSEAGGAGLDTYFVNACVISLANPVRRWRTGLRHHRWTETYGVDYVDGLYEDDAQHLGSGPRDPLDVVLESHDVEAVLRSLEPVLREALFLLIFTDLTRAQISRRLGTSRGSLDRMLRRFRDRYDPDHYGDNDD